MALFERPHHRRIAHVLALLDPGVLRAHACWFGGGTCIALRFGEYRESVDIDFLVSELPGYRELRHRLTGSEGLAAITRAGAPRLSLAGEVRADQYGIRTRVVMDGFPIKLEIVREARIPLQAPGPQDVVCGIGALAPLDLAATKMLANSDRYADDGVFSRDLIDLAMMDLPLPLLRKALQKAGAAYGTAVVRDLSRAMARVQDRQGWLERCMQAMDMRLPKAALWQKLRRLRRLLPGDGGAGASSP